MNLFVKAILYLILLLILLPLFAYATCPQGCLKCDRDFNCVGGTRTSPNRNDPNVWTYIKEDTQFPGGYNIDENFIDGAAGLKNKDGKPDLTVFQAIPMDKFSPEQAAEYRHSLSDNQKDALTPDQEAEILKTATEDDPIKDLEKYNQDALDDAFRDLGYPFTSIDFGGYQTSFQGGWLSINTPSGTTTIDLSSFTSCGA